MHLTVLITPYFDCSVFRALTGPLHVLHQYSGPVSNEGGVTDENVGNRKSPQERTSNLCGKYVTHVQMNDPVSTRQGRRRSINASQIRP